MAKGETSPRAEAFGTRAEQWQDELQALRSILLSTELIEEVKWGVPTYTFDGGNVAIINAFKKGAALSFMRGALLEDPEKILEKPGENTRAARVIWFTDVARIAALEPVLRAYLEAAIELERAGEKYDFAADRGDLPVPEELQSRLDGDPALKQAFEALTPGRRREYILHVSGAKQSKTRAARVEKYVPKILSGKGMRDR